MDHELIFVNCGVFEATYLVILSMLLVTSMFCMSFPPKKKSV